MRWLNPAAFATPQPGTFGNLPRNYLRGPASAQVDLMVSARTSASRSRQALQLRVEMFNIANRLNYENPAAALPERRARACRSPTRRPARSATCSGPLNRTVGLGTARQMQISVRYIF